MQEAVRCQLAAWGSDLEPGDVLVSNHPQLAGGSHLPDITVITPVWASGRIVFFLASRGHHADVGGVSPGSMPPHSTCLAEEGAAIVAHKLVARGVFDEAAILALLAAPGASGVAGATGARNPLDCLSDLRAQVAANQRGVVLVHELIRDTPGGLAVVHAYMGFILAAAEAAVRAMLVRFAARAGLPPSGGTVHAEDRMDDGTRIRLALTIDSAARSAVFDFSGTGPEVWGNTNAPRAVTSSAVIYVLRCLVGSDIPLNQGCLAPVDIRIPEGCILSPAPTSAVVGGNVLTSQRVVDVVLKAFSAAACSQGCMNNVTFGDSAFGYYETIAGGAGAGPSWDGASGVHTHMTNTRITDAETLERRYPVLLRRFSLRDGSGGAGAFAGGSGVVRELQFRRPLRVSVLSERRALPPSGLAGGDPGARGVNTLLRDPSAAAGDAAALARVVSLGGKASFAAAAGDTLRIETPGGGGYGALGDRDNHLAAAAARASLASGVAHTPRATGSLHALMETQNTQ